MAMTNSERKQITEKLRAMLEKAESKDNIYLSYGLLYGAVDGLAMILEHKLFPVESEVK